MVTVYGIYVQMTDGILLYQITFRSSDISVRLLG